MDTFHDSRISTIMNDITNCDKNEYKSNLINEKVFKDRMYGVFSKDADALKRTFGPYGSSTIIEMYGSTTISKDGWTVLKNIHYADQINNTIHRLLVDIAAPVVSKVGDGSTTAIVAADELNKSLSNIFEDENFDHIRPQELIDLINKCIDNISTHIVFNSIKINPDDNFKEIYNIAKISTNGNENIASMIQDIYQKTNNPVIEYSSSIGNETTYKIDEGFKSNISLLDKAYINSDDNNCNVDKPHILIFDVKITDEIYKNIIQPVGGYIINKYKNKLVVVAPSYDRHLLRGAISRDIEIDFQHNRPLRYIYTEVNTSNKQSVQNYEDFCMMTGGSFITIDDIERIFEEEDLAKRVESLLKYVGHVENMVIGRPDSYESYIKGFINRNEEKYNIFLKNAESDVKEKLLEDEKLNIASIELTKVRQRLARLKGNMGHIMVGGRTTLERDSIRDLVEDAIKACQSAYNYGYNIGCSLIVPIIISKLVENNKNTKKDIFTKEEIKIYELIKEAFKNVYSCIIENKYRSINNIDNYSESNRSLNQINSIINNSINFEQPFNLITENYDNSIINPCMTDVEVLKAASSIVSLLLSSNQYISIILPTK